MTLSTVVVTWDEEDAALQGVPGSITFTLATTLTDTTDGSEIRPKPRIYYHQGTGQSDPLVANDNTGVTPAGSYYDITVSPQGMTATTYQVVLNYADGATQKLSSLQQVTTLPTLQYLMPLPSGTPTSGQVPVATGVGEASAWGSAGGGGGGAVSSVFGRTGTVAATSGDYTVSEVTGAAPLASPAFTGTPTAPTAAALTDDTQLATTAYTDTAVGVETSRAETAEALKLAKASNLSDVASPAAALAALHGLYTAVPAPLPSGDTTGATDTAALNTALAALSAREALILPVPGYWINAPLSLPAGCGITSPMAYGVSSPHIKAATGFTGSAMIANAAYLNSLRTGDDGCEVSNLYIDGSNGGSSGPFVSTNGHGILLTGSHHHVHHNYVWNTSGAGIVMADFNVSGQSVNSGVTQENYVWDNKINNSGQWGIWVSKTSGSVGCTDGVIARNIVSDPSDGTYYAAGNGNPQINPATNQAYEAVRLDNAAGWWVTDNHTYFCPGGAIVVSGVYSTHALNNTCDIFGLFPWSVVSSVLTATTIIGMAVHTIKTDLAPYAGITANQKPSIISGNRMDCPEGKSNAPVSPASGTSTTGCRFTYYDLTADTLAVPAGAVGEADIVFTGNQSHQSSRGGQTAAACTTTNGSATVTAAGGTFANVAQKGMSVTGTGIPAGTYVGSVVTGGSDSLTLVASDLATPVTATASGTVTLTFPAPYSLAEKWTATTAGVTLNARHGDNLVAGTIIAAPLINATNGAVINLTGEFGGVVVSGVPSAGQAPVASSASAAAWGSPANITGTLDQVPAPAANVSLNSHKITGLANGAASSDAAAFGQIPVLDSTASDIQPAGVTAAAGSTGKAADAGHVHAGLAILGTTGVAGFVLQNATPNIFTWSVPNDGALHQVMVFGEQVVTSAETGGAVGLVFTDPTSTPRTRLLFNGGGGTGFTPVPAGIQVTVAPNTTVTLQQTSALTGGAATVYLTMWGI